MSLGLRVEDRLDGHSNYSIWKERMQSIFEEAVQLHLLQISGHANRVERTTSIAVLFLLFVHFLRRWLSTENEISCKSQSADFLFC